MEQRDLRINLIQSTLWNFTWFGNLFVWFFCWYLGFGYMACQLQRDLFGQHLAHQPRLSCQKCSPLASRTPRAVYRAPTAKGRRSMGTMGTGSVKGSISEFWCFCCRSYGLRGCRNLSFCFSGNMKQQKKSDFCRFCTVKHRGNPCNLSISLACPNFETWSSNIQHVAAEFMIIANIID